MAFYKIMRGLIVDEEWTDKERRTQAGRQAGRQAGQSATQAVRNTCVFNSPGKKCLRFFSASVKAKDW